MTEGKPLADREHYVYRVFDADDRLLYVGCARNVDERMRMHQIPSTQSRASVGIALHGDRVTSEEFPNRATARAAEAAAIRAESPLLNVLHNRTP